MAWLAADSLALSPAPVLKKVKHRLVENMSSGTADALGLSRAILCNGKSSFHPLAQSAIKLMGLIVSVCLNVDGQVTPLSLGSSSAPQELLQLSAVSY